LTDHQGLPAHLRQIESEAIGILREVAAEFRKPVMLYSIGKDSSVLLHLARKAFHPGKLPFPLMHIDTTWKFREMIAFRDATAARLGIELIVLRLCAPHPCHEDRGVEAGARQIRV
jgi:sulfate adenylyltransferase subunit 2